MDKELYILTNNIDDKKVEGELNELMDKLYANNEFKPIDETNEEEYVGGFEVGTESFQWIQDNVKNKYFVIKNKDNQYLSRTFIVFSNIDDSIHFKMIWS